MSEDQNIDTYLSSREREETEDQNQPEMEPSISGVNKAIIEGEGTNEQGQIPMSTVEQPQPQPQPQPKQQSRRASIRKIQRSIADVSKQMEKQTSQINKINQIVQALQKQMKSGQRQPELINQIRSQVNQVQRQLSQVQKSIQKKPTTKVFMQKSAKKETKKKNKKK